MASRLEGREITDKNSPTGIPVANELTSILKTDYEVSPAPLSRLTQAAGEIPCLLEHGSSCPTVEAVELFPANLVRDPEKLQSILECSPNLAKILSQLLLLQPPAIVSIANSAENGGPMAPILDPSKLAIIPTDYIHNLLNTLPLSGLEDEHLLMGVTSFLYAKQSQNPNIRNGVGAFDGIIEVLLRRSAVRFRLLDVTNVSNRSSETVPAEENPMISVTPRRAPNLPLGIGCQVARYPLSPNKINKASVLMRIKGTKITPAAISRILEMAGISNPFGAVLYFNGEITGTAAHSLPANQISPADFGKYANETYHQGRLPGVGIQSGSFPFHVHTSQGHFESLDGEAFIVVIPASTEIVAQYACAPHK